MRARAAVLALLVATFACSAASPARQSDDQIAKQLIARSIANYSGNCPCPYNSARNGSNCGGRSAYSRHGGEQPLCYRSDVTDEMVREYRKQMRE
jgi:hypothetical protein